MTDLRHLPRMQTDIVLRSPDAHDHPGHQVLQGSAGQAVGGRAGERGEPLPDLRVCDELGRRGAEVAMGPQPEGWLLYAAVDGGFDYRFELMGRPVRVCSVDLGQEWRGIEEGFEGVGGGWGVLARRSSGAVA